MSKTKILYVEDEPFLGRIVKESLESREFEVTMAADGKLAVSLFKESNPDICVFDIMLPQKDGYTLAKEIRNINALVPIIFVTAKTQTEDVLKGFDVGGNDYLRKPFSMEELIARVNNLLSISRNKNSGSKEVIEIGLYEFSVSRYELKINNQVKKLSHREASLLKMLCDNRHGTISRKDILMSLWGDDSFFNSRNLDVYITKLRDYLKDDPTVQIITIKGIGYHFSVG
ncbi:MAG: response regulator transcription factor [Cyclobacteriaceae bacterium]|nr:response regulator transcription factor [Cyclobacteriaceae bacterium]UYN87294.1 MAG: response regulator transcription factor [Cyclobacteriaceae bacterium]